MGSMTFLGVRFAAYSDDHRPPHVHGFYAGVEAIIELDPALREVRLADRPNNPKPRNAKRGDVYHIVKVAAAHFDELWTLWVNA